MLIRPRSKNGQGLLAAASALAENFRLRVREAQLRGLARAHSVGVNFSHRRDLILHHDEGADLVLACFGSPSGGDDDEQIRDTSAGDEMLHPIDVPMIFVRFRLRLDAAGVAARVRLGQTPAADPFTTR